MSKALPKIIAVFGPTGSGKTKLALSLAKRFRGEIIVADSRQMYRGMNIGTNKPIGVWKRSGGVRHFFVSGIPYHGIDRATPKTLLTLQQWKRFAERTIREICQRGHLPILEGGSALYLTALLQNLTIPKVPPNPALRKKLAQRLRNEGVASLAQEALRKDPKAQHFLDMKNPRRVVRALEILIATGIPLSEQRGRGPQRYDALRLALSVPLTVLDHRVSVRARQQFRSGLEHEMKALIRRYDWNNPALTGIGYAEWRPFFTGHIDRASVLSENIERNKRLVRQQLKWLRRDPNIQWISSHRAANAIVRRFLSS